MIASEAPPRTKKANSSVIQRRYDRQAARYDLQEAPMELLMGRWRRRLWSQVPPGSRVLEIGVGTGKNMRWYRHGVSVVGVDFSPRMLGRATRRARRQQTDVALALMDAQALGFADGCFDAVVATCVFCSVPDPVLGLQEVRRVLRPDGRILLLEHVRSRLPLLGRIMDWLNPLAVRLQGANINRDTVGNVQKAGLHVRRVSNLLLDIFKLIDGDPAAAGGTV